MSGDDDLLAWGEGEQRKREGMGRAEGNATDDWKAAFVAAGEKVLSMGLPFTSEDITAICGAPPEGSKNAIGAMMNSFARSRKLLAIAYIKATHPTRHAARVALWQPPTL